MNCGVCPSCGWRQVVLGAGSAAGPPAGRVLLAVQEPGHLGLPLEHVDGRLLLADRTAVGRVLLAVLDPGHLELLLALADERLL